MIDPNRLVTAADWAALFSCSIEAFRERVRADRKRPPHLRQLPDPLPGKPLRWPPIVVQEYVRGEWKPAKGGR